MADRPLSVALVTGYAAVQIAAVLDDVAPARLEAWARQVEAGRLHPEHLPELRLAWVAVRLLGAAWLAWCGAVDGNAASHVVANPTESSEIDTDRAAPMLGESASRVRQLVRVNGSGAGRSGGWLVDRVSLLTYREEAAVGEGPVSRAA